MMTSITNRPRATGNQALLLETTGARPGTSPAWFLHVDPHRATLMSHTRPTPGKTVAVCFTDPVCTGWISATVVGGELGGDGPYQSDLRFNGPLSDDLMVRVARFNLTCILPA